MINNEIKPKPNECCYCLGQTENSYLFLGSRYFVCNGYCHERIKQKIKKEHDKYADKIRKLLGIKE